MIQEASVLRTSDLAESHNHHIHPITMPIGIPGGQKFNWRSYSVDSPEPNYDVLLLGVIPRVCPGAAHGFTSLWRHSSVGVSLDSVAWSPLACAPLMWRSCRVDHLTTPSAADGITPGPADDLVRPEVLDAFLVGRAECSPNLWFSDDQER